MGRESVADQTRHTAVTSENGCLKTWCKSRGNTESRWMEKISSKMCSTGTPDGSAKERRRLGSMINVIL